MKKFSVFFTLFLLAFPAVAICPMGDAVARKLGMEAALPHFIACAEQRNDDDAQFVLGQYYAKQKRTAETVQKALFYYTYAADSGHAAAQVALARFLLELDKQADTRAFITDYYKSAEIAKIRQTGPIPPMNLPPYALLLLAGEPAADKWYYPSAITADATAQKALDDYLKTLSPDKKRAGEQLAKQWKDDKLRAAAREVLSPTDFDAFEKTVFPKQGKPDAFTYNQTLSNLKTQIDAFKSK